MRIESLLLKLNLLIQQQEHWSGKVAIRMIGLDGEWGM
jgi:hypothetical protein